MCRRKAKDLDESQLFGQFLCTLLLVYVVVGNLKSCVHAQAQEPDRPLYSAAATPGELRALMQTATQCTILATLRAARQEAERQLQEREQAASALGGAAAAQPQPASGFKRMARTSVVKVGKAADTGTADSASNSAASSDAGRGVQEAAVAACCASEPASATDGSINSSSQNTVNPAADSPTASSAASRTAEAAESTVHRPIAEGGSSSTSTTARHVQFVDSRPGWR